MALLVAAGSFLGLMFGENMSAEEWSRFADLYREQYPDLAITAEHNAQIACENSRAWSRMATGFAVAGMVPPSVSLISRIARK